MVKRYKRILAGAAAVALGTALAPMPTASADVATVKRISCPSTAEVNQTIQATASPKRQMIKLKATAITCEYWVQGTVSPVLSVGFVPGVSTMAQAQDFARNRYPAEFQYLFQPQPLPTLGAGAFYFVDLSPAFVYWELSPGAIVSMTGLAVEEGIVPVAKLFRPMMEVYTIPGERTVNGRQWRTTCEPYSQTVRCRTEIFATTIEKTANGYRTVNGWAFNSLTYRWSARALWTNNPLGNTGEWTSADSRKWRTECDTSNTGRGACRSYIWTTVIALKDGKYTQSNMWVFNNQVLFSD